MTAATTTLAAGFVAKGYRIPEHALPSGGPSGAVARRVTTPPLRPLLRKLGYSPRDWSGPRTVKAFLHDTAFQCANCFGWFCEADMAEEADPWVEPTWECRWCRFNLHREAA